MKIRSVKIISLFLALIMLSSLLLTSSVTAFAQDRKVPPRETAAASASSADEFDLHFESSAYEYDHALARIALSLSLNSYVYGGTGWCDGEEYDASSVVPNTDAISAARYSAIAREYKTLGFDEAFYYNYNVTLNDASDKVAFSVGIKRDVCGSTLVSVIIRGISYGAEWTSNLNLGSGEPYHLGFYTAAEAVFDKVLADPDFDTSGSDVKYFVAGCSRGGAVANILSAMLDDAAQMSEQFDPEDVYAYTFASPATVTDVMRPDDPIYSNIHNVINSSDMIAHIIPESWGFSRYGVTHRFSTLSAYGEINAATVYNLNKNHLAVAGYGLDARESLLHQTAIYALSEYFSYKMPTPEHGYDLLECLREIFEYLNTYERDEYGVTGRIGTDSFASVLSERYGKKYQTAKKLAEADMKLAEAADAVSLITDALGIDAECAELLFTICELHGMSLLKLRSLIVPIASSFDFGAMLREHYAELYTAWMMLDEDECFGRDDVAATTVLTVAGDVDITVLCDNREIVSVADGDIISSELPTVKRGGTVSIYFSVFSEERYTVEIAAAEACRVAYTATEIDMSLSMTARASYGGMKLEPDVPLVIDFCVTDRFSDTKYSAHRVADGLDVTYDYCNISEGELIYSDVTLTATDGGTVNGGGKYINGDFAVAKASPAINYRFVGWYCDGELVSADDEYLMQVVESINLNAVFESELSENPHDSDNGDGGSTSRDESNGADDISGAVTVIITVSAVIIAFALATAVTFIIIKIRKRKNKNPTEQKSSEE